MDVMSLLPVPGASALDVFQPKAAGLPELGFFMLIYDFLSDEIATRMSALLGRATTFATSIMFVLMTIWVWWQGWRIVTGQSQESMARFFAQSAQRVFILAMAFGVAVGGTPIFTFLSDGLPRAVNEFVTGKDEPLGSKIDDNLLKMQLAMSSIDLLQTGGSVAVEDAKSRAQWFAGIGTGGPAIVGGTMLLMFKIALGLFVGFGPIFILCLLFDFTKQLFSKWLFYGIGTMFAMALLAMMVEIATRMVTNVAAALWLDAFLTSLVMGDTAGINSRAMQQGGLGLILTMMIISVPPMAAAFFNGVLGQFTPYAAFGAGAQTTPGARGPGSPPGAYGGGFVNNSQAGQTGERSIPAQRGSISADPQVALGPQRATGVPDDRIQVSQEGTRGNWQGSTASPMPTVRATSPSPAVVPAPPAVPSQPPRGPSGNG
jgi:type IV secretion system protein VirB6